MKRVVSLLVGLTLILSLVAPSAFALDGVWHEPYGNNCIYDIGETERIPRNPAEGENVIVKGTTWPIEPGQSVWATYTVNGEPRTDKGAEWKYNSGNNTYWEISLGSFAKGDTVEYTVWAAKDGADFKQVGPFTFHVTGWEHAKQVALDANLQDHIVFDVIPDQGTFSPKLSLSFTNSKTLRFQLSPKGTGTFASGISDYALTETDDTVVITTDSLRVTVTKSPYGIEIYFYSSGAYEQSIHQNVSVPNGTYNVDAWVKVSNTAPTIGRLEIVDYGGDAIYQDMPQTGSGWHHVQISNVLVTNGTINVGFYVKSSGGTTVHIDAVRLLKVSDAAIQISESDVDAEEHDIPVIIASTEEQETASEETSPEESALYEDSENVEEIATPESAQPASDSTIPLEESEYAQEVA